MLGIAWAKDEVSRRTKAGRVGILVWFWVIVAGWVVATVLQAVYGHYADAAAESVVFVYIWAIKWLWPLGIARAVRRRGGVFQNWHPGALIFGWLIPGILYLIFWASKPIVQD